ncbi:MAG: S49 family peptidase [Alphaproteobacteria bacterium]|nr:S49 family peptidase [Alphaproteobacteria bacterium]
MDIESLLAHLPIERFRNPPPLVTVLRLHGIIGERPSLPGRAGLSLAHMAEAIEAAFAPSRLAAVALSINSPGGSPVQSSLLCRRIRQKAREKNVPVLAFVEDVGASGGYMLACAGDEIHVDESSIVGSIGVVTSTFGLHRLIERFGVERRLYTAGERKAMLDPFRPENPDDVARLRHLQDEIHASFRALVRERREGKLAEPEEDLFEGDIWTGRRAVELGLADGIGDLREVCRKRFGEKVRLRLMRAERPGLLRRMLGATRSPAPDDWLAAIEDRALWSRFGL